MLVHVEAAPGTSLPEMTEITEQAVPDLGSLPGVVNVGGQVGRAVMSDQIVNVNSGEIWVKVDAGADHDARWPPSGHGRRLSPECRPTC